MHFTTKRQDCLAFDRAASARTYDGDGHLHVKQCHISKAMVCPYLGREIPEADKLGLDADRVYYLLRHPGELERAADTFNGKPLLFDHKPVTADDHDHDLTVGAVSNVKWNPPYLDADISCWSGSAIEQIEDESRKQLSSAYRYTADMTPGTFEGVRYDGIMRDIVGNHVSLVKAGRAGPDVVVGDSAIGIIIMPHTARTRFSAFAQGAVSSYAYGKKLAQDAKPVDLAPLFVGLDAANFKTRKPVLALGIKGALAGKLAADEDLNDVDAMLDRVEAAVEDLADTVEEAKGEEAPAEDDSNGDVIAFLSGKISDEDLEKVKAMLADNDSTPVAPVAADTDKAPAMDAKPAASAPKVDMSKYVTKTAMDAAIARAAADGFERATRAQTAIREAEQAVRPWVGDLAMAHDSAADVYRTALASLNVDVTGIDPSAYPAMLKLVPKPGDAPKRVKALAQDTAALAEAQKAFPHMNRLGA